MCINIWIFTTATSENVNSISGNNNTNSANIHNRSGNNNKKSANIQNKSAVFMTMQAYVGTTNAMGEPSRRNYIQCPNGCPIKGPP